MDSESKKDSPHSSEHSETPGDTYDESTRDFPAGDSEPQGVDNRAPTIDRHEEAIHQIEEMESQWAGVSGQHIVSGQHVADEHPESSSKPLESVAMQNEDFSHGEPSTEEPQVAHSPPTHVHESSVFSHSKTEESPSTNSMVLSTLLSLMAVLILLIAVRFLLPPLLERSRYAWVRAELRAEAEVAGDKLSEVSLDGLSSISQLVSKRASPAVVHIIAERESALATRLRLSGLIDENSLDLQSQGSGIVVDERGYLLTNSHVLEGSKRVRVRLSDDRNVPGVVVGNDPRTDLAVIKIDADSLVAIDWGDSDEVEVGSPVWALGSPFGLAGSITFGILSGKHRMSLEETQYMDSSLNQQARYGDLMQSDVAVNPGNSGGPLVNARGELIGVNTAILGESYRGVSFSIPSNVARRVYESILRDGVVQRGWIGVRISNIVSDDSTLAQQVVVSGFSDPRPSPAEQAGIQSGDAILSIAGNAVRSSRDVAVIVETLTPGDTYIIRVLRNNKVKDIEIVVGTLSKLAM